MFYEYFRISAVVDFFSLVFYGFLSTRISELQLGFPNFGRVFWISVGISELWLGFLNSCWDFRTLVGISGFLLGFRDFCLLGFRDFCWDSRISSWISRAPYGISMSFHDLHLGYTHDNVCIQQWQFA